MVRSQAKFTLFNIGKKIYYWHYGREICRGSRLGLGENVGRVRSTYSPHMLSFHGLWSYGLHYCFGKKTEDRNVLCFHGPGARNPRSQTCTADNGSCKQQKSECLSLCIKHLEIKILSWHNVVCWVVNAHANHYIYLYKCPKQESCLFTVLQFAITSFLVWCRCFSLKMEWFSYEMEFLYSIADWWT